MYINIKKTILLFATIILLFNIISCPNNQMRDLVELKVSDPVADSFTIGSGPTTASRTVTLYSDVTKEEDALEMRFRNSGDNWSDWETYSNTKIWDLSFLDGLKTVYAEYRDEGHHVVSRENTITLNTGAPGGEFYIFGNGLIDNPVEDNQHEYTNTTSVKLCMNITNVESMRFSNTFIDNNISSWDAVTPLIPFSEEYDWSLPAGDGEKTVYAQFVTNAGTPNVFPNSPVDGHQPYLDTTAPSTSNFSINGGAAIASSISVTLSYDISETVFDSEHKMWAEYRNDGGSWSAKETVSTGSITPKPWVLRSEVGTRTVYVRLSDIAGNSAVFSDTIDLDNAAPPIPSPTTATPTNNTKPTWTWAAVPGAVNYRCYFPDFPIIELGDVTSYTPDDPLYENQDHEFHLQAADAAGNWSAPGTHTVTIDTELPPSPTGLDLAESDDTGSSNSDNITRTTSNLTISGNAESNSEVLIYNNTTLLTTVNTNGSGDFSGDISLSGDGVKSVRAICIDTAGNQSPYSSTLSITIDTTLPSAPSTPDLAAADDHGSSSSDNITNQTSNLTFSGTAEAGSSVTIYESSTARGTFTASGGTYSGDISLSAGSNKNISARATDIAGNISSSSTGLSVTIDTTSPSAPSTPDLATADDHGSSSSDNITNQTSNLTFSGTAEAGSSVTIYENSTARGTFTASGGTYSGDISLSAGSNRNISARATDIAGNISSSSTGLSVTIDTTAPPIPSVSVDPYNAGSATWSWSASGATRYRYKLNNTNLTTGATITTSGSTTISSGLTAGQTHYVYVQSGDTAGNWSGTASASTISYSWSNTYTNGLVLGSQLLGGRTTDTIGAGQGGITLTAGSTIKTFGFYLTSGFGGNAVSLRLDLRNSSGTIMQTRTLNLPSSFSGGWIYWTGFNYSPATTASYIFTTFVYGSSGDPSKYSSIRAEVSSGSNPAGFAYDCTGTSDTEMGTWSNWSSKSIDWDFWYRAYGD